MEKMLVKIKCEKAKNSKEIKNNRHFHFPQDFDMRFRQKLNYCDDLRSMQATQTQRSTWKAKLTNCFNSSFFKRQK